jgi:asparagine synthase (glutamine-hydrolysing)
MQKAPNGGGWKERGVCGICGLASRQKTEDSLRESTTDMASLLGHRGPDGQGVWAGDGVGLGHTRLSIIDLSPAGRQPMESPSGRWVVTFNGEIYNHQALRADLSRRGVPFLGHSDTETLVAALDAYGLEQTLPLLVGMFAMGAWDRQRQRLYLARDRAGQKPLFYGFHEGDLVFGSECRIVEAFSNRPPLARESLALMLRYNCIPAPFTVYEDFRKLPPASYLIFSFADWSVGEPIAYWSPCTAPPSMGQEEVKGETRRLLEDSVRLRMISDVPLGAFLSGGIDSSLIVGVMQRISTKPVRTFTIDFEDLRFSEAGQARAVAQHLGTIHTELKVTGADALAVVPALGAISDEPFGDSSLMPTLLLSQLTRRSVTVALTGDGGDELFGGYHRQIWLPRVARMIGLLPAPLRNWLGGTLASPGVRSKLLWLLETFRVPLRTPEEKLDKLAHLVLQGGSLEALYRSSLSHARRPGDLFCQPVKGASDEFARVPPGLSPFDRVCRADFTFYMPNDVLVKVDRASMHYGLEARSPFLDHRLVDFALGLEQGFKVGGGSGKLLLKSLLADLLPARLLSQPKMGFAVPLGSWLRESLRPWAQDLLATRWLDRDELLERDAVVRLWNEHLSGRRDHHHLLWNILMLVSWLEAHR